MELNLLDLKGIRVKLASPETIRSWSHGEVKKADTINYKTQKPERDGLFCERIFGPVKDYECNCGKYRGPKYKGVVCERCGVEVTTADVRRKRMGHIELAAPVVHIWFYKVQPSRIGVLLDMPLSKLEQIIYYNSYVVIEPGESDFKKGELIPIEEYEKIMENPPDGFKAETGAEAIYLLLKELDLDKMAAELRTQLALGEVKDRFTERYRKLFRKLQIIEAFRTSGVKPEWMVLRVLPVIPPDLRPLVPLEGGRYATTDLNDLYRRVITRNNRLKNLIAMKAPEIIIRNEKRMLQEAVDALLDNRRKSKPVKGRGDRPLKSLSDALSGKRGRFRQNLLGKRVDYSGRAVIIVDPTLKIHECGVPKTMAIELFKPMVMRELQRRGYAQSAKVAKKMIEKGASKIWELLEEVVKNHPVLLNRAPTLHRLSIQAFYPKLVDGKAIMISPLICKPFNADFDGDQMAIHVPISTKAQLEAMLLMLSTNNILSPASGEPISVPTQDMIMGVYYVTLPKKGEKGEGKYFGTPEEVKMALDEEVVTWNTIIKYRFKDKIIETTPGRVLFNELLPEDLRFCNEVVDKKVLNRLIAEIHKRYGNFRTCEFLDAVKEFGFEMATLAGVTIGIDDMKTPPTKEQIIERAKREVAMINESYRKGWITERERYNRIVDIWGKATAQIERDAVKTLQKDREGFNPLYMMAISGARGNIDQVRQITAQRGLMTRPGKGAIETPINSSLKEGLTVVEYFISTHGARKGLTDTALKTAQAGYLTRRLVDVAQDVIVTEEDCGTILGREVTALMEGEEIIEPLSERIAGRYALEDIVNPITGEVIVFAGELITPEKAKEIESAGIEKVLIRSVLTCETKRGVCQKCYGIHPGTGRLVELGEAVGIVAAQSIGEPGTQLTLRTFHVGGAVAGEVKETKMKAHFDGEIKFENVKLHTRKDGKKIFLGRKGKIILEHGDEKKHYKLPYGAIVFVEEGQKVKKDDDLFEWDPYSFLIISEVEGEVHFNNWEENVSYRLEYDEKTGAKQPVVTTHKRVQPSIDIIKDGKTVASYTLPNGAYVFVKEGQYVYPGDILARKPKVIAKVKDITGGLPKAIDLFEARHPKDKALVPEIDGYVKIVSEKGERYIIVKGEHEEKKYKVPVGKHIIVRDGDFVRAGEKLTDGIIDPHDILKTKGVHEVRNYLVDEIQKIYRMQGVKINDKHFEIIVRQMLSKVKIKDAGDTRFIEGEVVNIWEVMEENERVKGEGKQPASYEPLLLGIAKAAVSSESFIAAASFQETVNVLTDAAIKGRVDYLRGIKENVITGCLIPAGTGFRKFKEEVVYAAHDKSVDKEGEKKEEKEVEIPGT